MRLVGAVCHEAFEVWSNHWYMYPSVIEGAVGEGGDDDAGADRPAALEGTLEDRGAPRT